MEEYFQLGYVKRCSGLKGVMIIAPETDRPEQYLKEAALFLEEHGSAVPHFIESIELDAQGLYRVKLEDVQDAEQASRLIGNAVFLPLDRLPELDSRQFYYHEIIGWSVKDQGSEHIGTIRDVFDRGMQELLMVDRENGATVFLPLADELLLDVNRAGSFLQLHIAEGLLELNSGSDEDQTLKKD